MPGHSDILGELPDVRVFIVNPHGKYLAHDAHGVFFTEDRSAAIILSYHSDRVPEQLEQIRKHQGIALQAVPVPPADIYECCDRCKELFMPAMTFFDGKNFLCPECRNRTVGRARRAASPTLRTNR